MKYVAVYEDGKQVAFEAVAPDPDSILREWQLWGEKVAEIREAK